jgi:hypothetical protein
MRIDIFAEGSSTPTEEPDTDTFRDYFGGGFLSVPSLEDELREFGETELFILSDEWGFVKGSDKVPEHPEGGSLDDESGRGEFREQIRESASEAEVLVLLFTKDTFRTTVADQWDELVEAGQPGSIWCISTSRKAFDSVDLDQLEEKGIDLVRYNRVGVARIGTETREELIERIDG